MKRAALLLLAGMLTALTACVPPPAPRLPQEPDAEQARPGQVLEQARRVPAPGPPPFQEKLAPAAAGIAADTRLYSVNFDNVHLGAVIRSLVRDSGLSLSVASEVDLERPVTVHARNNTLAEVLDLAVLKGGGYAWKLQAGRLEIDRFVERTFVFDYLDVPGTTEVNVGGDMLGSSVEQSGVNGKFQVQSKRAEARADVWTQVRKVLEGIKSEDGVIQLNPQAGLIYMADTPRKVATMVQFLESLAASLHRQVLIEAKVLEVRLNELNRYGIDWSSVTMAINPNSFADRFFDDLNLNLNRNGLITLSQNTTFDAIVDALETQGDVSVLSNPHLSVMNGQSAVMTVGSQFPFSDITGVSRDEDTDVVTIDTTIKRAVFGVQLGITPQISADGIVTLNVVPTLTRQEGTEQVEVPVGSAEVVSFDNPIIALQELATTVRMRDGEAVVIGGLISQERTVRRTGLPGLRRIPGFSYIFGNAETDITNRELVIVLRPFVRGTI
jgi:MSHA biogenesis protein MshL